MNNSEHHFRLAQLLTGYWVTQAVYAAAKFGIADLLKDGPQTVEHLATATKTQPECLYRVLRALASIEVFAEVDGGRFQLTPLAELLRSDVPGSKRSFALMVGEEQFLAWGNLADTVRTGENAFQKLFGKPIFDYLSEHPEKGRIFDDAMTGIHGRETAAMLDAFDFTGINRLADIGGGNGSTLSAILQQYPSMQGMLFDLPAVVERTRARIDAAGLSERCRVIGGSFFDSIPSGADAYFLRHIIHDWDDEKSLTILRNCRAAMAPNSRLLIVESVIPPGNDPFFPKFLDLTMMLIPGGKERTETEYLQLFEQSGFKLSRIVSTTADVHVIEGLPQ